LGWQAQGGRWRAEYERRTVGAAEAVAHVRGGQKIWIPPQQHPEALLLALVGRAGELRDVQLESILLADYGWFLPELADAFQPRILQAVEATRPFIEDRSADFVPWWAFLAHKAADEGRGGARRMDVTMFSVSPPNENGWCCFGNVLWDARECARRASLVLAEVNDQLPHTFGDGWIHVSEIDWFVPNSHTPTFFDFADPTPVDRAIADNVAELLRDRDCIQTGTGASVAALLKLGVFRSFRELGWFTEMTMKGTMELVEDGMVTCEHVNPNPGHFVATGYNCDGDIERIRGNPFFWLKPVSYVHDPRVIGSIDNMVSLNSALSIDLTGQIASGSIGTRIWSGTGGQLSFAMGALFSRGGRYICLMPSTARDGSVSRIVPQFAPGQAVTVPREMADIVVTEHGVANLLYKSQRERANELVNVAHPEHRAALRRAADAAYGPLR
jgi:acyl-CoA hydrolase